MEELQTLFEAIDRDGNGELTYEEVCRHYVSDTAFLCAKKPEKVEITDPNYMSQDRFEGFWQAFDPTYMNAEMTQVERDNFLDAIAEVNLFDDMTDAEIMAAFDSYDLDEDGI